MELFLAKRTRDKCSPTTIRLDIKIIKTVLNSARTKGLITTNPAAVVELTHGSGVESGTFTPTAVQMLVDSASKAWGKTEKSLPAKGEWPDLIRLGYFTGQRLGDCISLRWGQVDLVGGTITFRPQKTKSSGKEVAIPIHPEQEKMLHRRAGDQAGAVLPNMGGLGVGGRHGLSDVVERDVIMHESEAVSRKYTHIDMPTKRKPVQAIPDTPGEVISLDILSPFLSVKQKYHRITGLQEKFA